MKDIMEQKRLNELAFAVVVMKLMENRLPMVDNHLQNEFRSLQRRYNVTAEQMKAYIFAIWNRLAGKQIVESQETAEVNQVAYYSVLGQFIDSPMSFGERSAKQMGQIKKSLKDLGFVFTSEEIEAAYKHFEVEWFKTQKARVEKLIRDDGDNHAETSTKCRTPGFIG